MTTPTPPSAMEEAEKIVRPTVALTTEDRVALRNRIARALSERDDTWAHEFIQKIADAAYPKGYSGGRTHDEILNRVEKIAKWLEEHQVAAAELSAQLRERGIELSNTRTQITELLRHQEVLHEQLGEREREVERLREGILRAQHRLADFLLHGEMGAGPVYEASDILALLTRRPAQEPGTTEPPKFRPNYPDPAQDPSLLAHERPKNGP